ncbi:MAG: HD domain-containing protein [Proteobacteria bacterium]|nr:HD domain-containing protein [Pseudomonadota bacterium]
MSLHILGLCIEETGGSHFMLSPWIVVLSFLVAVLGSFAALDMTERLHRAHGRMAILWLMGSATTLGGGIWSMHFIGMLAVRANFPVNYDPGLTVLSLVMAIAACAVGLHLVRGAVQPDLPQLLGAGVVVGLGVAAMHYTGMSALQLPGTLSYTPGLFLISVLLAIGAATAAFWLSCRLDRMWQRLLAALAMGGAICGMHYVGMAATVIHFDPLIPPSQGLARGPLTVAVTGTTIALLAVVLVFDAAHRGLAASSRREVETLLIANREIIHRLCAVGEFRDDATGRHVLRLARIASRLASRLGCNDAFARLILETAPLHDIGKIAIPDSILRKPGALTDAEWQIMRSHTEIGNRILSGSGMPLLDLAAEIALTHHEKWDGTGYPRGLRGEEIPLVGRIVAVADVFDALLSERSYKKAWPLAEVVAFLRHESGRHFDPRIVTAFLADLDAMATLRSETSPAPGGADDVARDHLTTMILGGHAATADAVSIRPA